MSLDWNAHRREYARLTAALETLRHREDQVLGELSKVNVALDHANAEADQKATQLLIGDVSKADVERARACVSEVQRQRAALEERLVAIRHEASLGGEARRVLQIKLQRATKDELMPQYVVAITALAAALKAVRAPLAQAEALADQMRQLCSNDTSGTFRDSGITDPAVLGLPMLWLDHFVTEPDSTVDIWLRYAREHVAGI